MALRRRDRSDDAMGPAGTLVPVPLRELWRHEARDFSSWLAKRLHLLRPVIGIALIQPRQEVRLDSFVADIVAEDERGNLAVIENQLELSDHSHLGQMVTYMAAIDARTGVWIGPGPRPEHARAVAWLNLVTQPDYAFHLVKVHTARIGNSQPAAIFTRVAGPGDGIVALSTRTAPSVRIATAAPRFWRSRKG